LLQGHANFGIGAFLSGSGSGTPQAHIERALSTVTDMRLVETGDQRAELRKVEPSRDLPAKHAALGARIVRSTLAGDDKHECKTVARGGLQKTQQRTMRPRLRHAMQVDPGIDVFSPP
jgi:hypothetical protein